MKMLMLIFVLIFGSIIAGMGVAVFFDDRPVPRCKFINGREIVTGACIPYCPPDPKECE